MNSSGIPFNDILFLRVEIRLVFDIRTEANVLIALIWVQLIDGSNLFT